MKWLEGWRAAKEKKKEEQKRKAYEEEYARAENLYNTIQRIRMSGGVVDIDFDTILYLEEYGFRI